MLFVPGLAGLLAAHPGTLFAQTPSGAQDHPTVDADAPHPAPPESTSREIEPALRSSEGAGSQTGEGGAEVASEPVPKKRAEALALTVSGAVSLGSHEAGQLFLVTEALRKSPGSVPLRVTTGASAGSANALIAGSEACLERDLTAEESIGYRAWVDVGLDELFDPERTTKQAIFHTDALQRSYGYLEALWKRGLPADCEFAYGVAVTRKSSAEMKLADGLVIPRSAERFVVRIEGQKSGPPRLFNYVDAMTTHNRPLLPFTGSYEDDANALRPVVLASAAFPVAFPAQPIEHCVSNETAKDAAGACTEPTRVDLFVDGGVFDNNPLGIAYRTARSGLQTSGGRVRLREKPDGAAPSDADVVYGYVDPDLRSYPLYTPSVPEEEPDDDPVVSLITRMGGQMLADARGHELASLADENIKLLEDLWMIRAHYPPISELLGAFFGFFERDFRDFDFYLGTYDSFVDLRDKSSVRLGTESYIRELDGVLAGPLAAVPARYRKLACIAGYVGEKKYRHLTAACHGEGLRNFRVLLQVAIDRLWSNCRFLPVAQAASSDHLACKQARGGLEAPRVDSSFVVSGSRYQQRAESDFDYALRLLADYGFHFRDLGLSPNKADRARLTIRRKLISMVESLSSAQGSLVNRTAVMAAGRTLINSIYYEPPQKRAYVGVGSSIYGGYLGRVGGLRTLYWNPDVRMLNLREMLTGANVHFSAQVSLGAEIALLPLSGRLWQTAIGIRGGYQFSAADGIGLDPCIGSEVGSDSRRCSGPVIQTPFNFTLIERVRFSATPVFYPLAQEFGHEWVELELGVGVELY